MPWTAIRLRERLSAAFRAEGLDPALYLRTTAWLPRSRFMSFLDEMDICLDCPAFSGYTTAWQALHSGLPIITLEGQFMRQRLASGLLRQAGVTDGITASGEQYVAAAVGWANECRDTSRWAERRAELHRAASMTDGNRSAMVDFAERLRKAL
jgi:predicted O-linked N-acetylglucosamine transferase (SPINDLY family)